MTRPASPLLTLAKHALTGAAALTWLAGLALALDAISTRGGSVRGWSLDVAGDVLAALCLAGPAGAVTLLNARRIEAEGLRRLAWALAGAASALAAFFGLGLSCLMAGSVLETTLRQTLNTQFVAAAVFPLLAVVGAAGAIGAWTSVAEAPPAWASIRRLLVRALGVASGCGALLVLIAMVRGNASALAIGAPLFVTLAALTAALAIRARKDGAAGELIGALIGYAAGAFGGLIAAGVVDAWQTPGDPRARFFSLIFLWPVLVAGLMLAAGAVVAVAGSFRALFGRVRRALA